MSYLTDNAIAPNRRDVQIVSLSSLSSRFHRFCKLQQVVCHADQAPFACHLRKSTQQELPEAASRFDLTEDRLGQRLAKSVATTPTSPRDSSRRWRRTPAFGSGRSCATTTASLQPVAAQCVRSSSPSQLGAELVCNGQVVKQQNGHYCSLRRYQCPGWCFMPLNYGMKQGETDA